MVFCQTMCFAQTESDDLPRNLKSADQRVQNLISELEQAEIDQDTAKLISITNDLMLRYSLMHHLERSYELAKANLIRATQWGDECLLGQTFNRYGFVMANQMKYDRFSSTPYEGFFIWADSALFYYQNALQIGISDEECRYNPKTWAYLGLQMTHYFIARMSHRNFNLALVFGDSAQTHAIRLGDHEAEIDSYTWTARSYSMAGQYNSAKKYIKQAHELSKTIERDWADIYDIWHATLIKETGNDTLLWLHTQILASMRKRAGEERQAAIQDADIKYETGKKEQQLLLQKQQIKNRDQIILMILSGVVVVGILALYLYRLFKRNKRLSNRLELLLKEQNHRVKNNLQMINSLLSLQSQKLLSTDARNALNESQGRINSVALLHRMLYEGEELGIINTKQYLDNLIEEIGYTSGREVTWEIEIDPEIHVSVEKATSLGLIVNELITNSIKHVAQEIKLIIQLGMNKLNDDIELEYADNGIDFNPEVWKTSESFGNQLIRIQSDQLRGTFKVDNNMGFNYLLKIIA